MRTKSKTAKPSAVRVSAGNKRRDKKSREEIKKEIDGLLMHGRAELDSLLRRINDKKNQEKVIARIGKLKKDFEKYEERAVAYTRSNPKKALVAAAAAGVLVGRLLGLFRRKKNRIPIWRMR